MVQDNLEGILNQLKQSEFLFQMLKEDGDSKNLRDRLKNIVKEMDEKSYNSRTSEENNKLFYESNTPQIRENIERIINFYQSKLNNSIKENLDYVLNKIGEDKLKDLASKIPIKPEKNYENLKEKQDSYLPLLVLPEKEKIKFYIDSFRYDDLKSIVTSIYKSNPSIINEFIKKRIHYKEEELKKELKNKKDSINLIKYDISKAKENERDSLYYFISRNLIEDSLKN